MSVPADCDLPAPWVDLPFPQAALPTFAVGTRVTSRPPHRSVRAAFPHTAPTSGIDGSTLPLRANALCHVHLRLTHGQTRPDLLSTTRYRLFAPPMTALKPAEVDAFVARPNP